MSSGTLSPAFASGTTTYTASVSNATTSVTVTPVPTNGAATIKVNGLTSPTTQFTVALNVGANVITTVVTAENGTTTKTYKVTVTRVSNNAVLTQLKVTPSTTLTVVSGVNYRDYTTTVPNTEASVQITPTAQDPTATIKVNGVTVASGTASASIPLAVGDNVINTVITAQDGVTQRTYSIKFTRQPAPVAVPVYAAKADPTLDNGLRVHQNVSPNGDGKGDVMLIDGITAYPENKIQIMSRSGALVYEVKGYDNETKVFDGHSSTNGKLQQAGTYFYSLEYKDGNEIKHKTGFIVLKY
jgi:gliding motility-associated-like protein